MPLSKETLQVIARDLWGAPLPPTEAEAAMALLGPAMEGVAELDQLDLEALEPALIFHPTAE